MINIFCVSVAAILLFLIILLNVFIAWPLINTREHFAQRKIPKVIWTYWDDKKIPPIIQECIDTWKYHNPDYKINILNKHNYKKYIKVDVYDMKHCRGSSIRASDFIRLFVIEKHGGIWMDASIVCFASFAYLDHEDLRHKDFVGFKIPNFMTDCRFPVIENWSFAAVPKSKFMTRWLAECLNMHKFESLQAYVDDARDNKKVDLQNIQGASYLACHVAAQYVLQKVPDDSYNMHLFNATGENAIFGKGPYFYLNKAGWESAPSLALFCSDERAEYAKTKFVKLRDAERNQIKTTRKQIDCVFELAYASSNK